MDLRYSAAEEQFRDELHAWLVATLPTLGAAPPADDWPARRAFDSRWQRLLFDAGYAGVDWPAEGGGRGASPVEQLIFKEECERAGAPYVGVNFVGLLHAGPTIIAEGTAAQKERYLPAILRGDDVWCQGFSEPDAGSDLASLRTRAARDGDEYVVTGSKIWTSHAEVADHCEMLVRTGEEGRRGITLVDRAHGLGRDRDPTVAHHCRLGPSSPSCSSTRCGSRWRTGWVRRTTAGGSPWSPSPSSGARHLSVTCSSRCGCSTPSTRWPAASASWTMRDSGARLGHLTAAFDALWALTKRNVSEAAETGVPGIGGSVFKLSYSEQAQALSDLAMEVLDRGALCADPLLGPDGVGLGNDEQLHTWFKSISLTIAAGTSQVQRNIVAERILGLPKVR